MATFSWLPNLRQDALGVGHENEDNQSAAKKPEKTRTQLEPRHDCLLSQFRKSLNESTPIPQEELTSRRDSRASPNG